MKSRFILLPTSEALIERFVKFLIHNGKAESTISHYRSILTSYMSYTEHEVYDPFSRRAVEGYLFNKRRSGCNSNTLRGRYFILKCFFESMGHDKDWTFNKIDVPPELNKKANLKPALDQSEMYRLEETARGRCFKNRTSFTRLRNVAIALLNDELGLRRVEIANLDFDDVHITPEAEYPIDRLRALTDAEMEFVRIKMFHHHLHIRVDKRREGVVREVSPKTVRALQEYAATRLRSRTWRYKKKYGDEAAFFVTRSGDRITPHALSELHLSLRKAAGIEKRGAGFQAARRGRITDTWRAGLSHEEITAEWGLQSLSTLDNILVPDKEETKKKIRKINPYFDLK